MSTLPIRTYRVLACVVALVFGLSLLAPIMSLADASLVPGDQATVTNPNGSGANLRSDVTTLDDSTIVAELPQGATVTIGDGPVANDNGTWFYVFASTGGEGWIDASLLQKAEATNPDESDAPTAPEAPASTEPVTTVAWLEPIDTGVVVDDNLELPSKGLAVKDSPASTGVVLGYAPVGSSLDVTEARQWGDDAQYLRVNFQGAGGYVNASYLALASEQVPEAEPTEEVVPTEAVAPTEDVLPTEEIVPTEVMVPTEEVIPTEVVLPTEEVVPTEEVIPTEVVAPTEAVDTSADVVPTEVVPTDVVVPTEEVVPTDVVAPTENVVPTEAVPTEAVATEAPTEEAGNADVSVDAAVSEETAATSQAVDPTAAPTGTPGTPSATDVAGTPAPTESQSTPETALPSATVPATTTSLARQAATPPSATTQAPAPIKPASTPTTAATTVPTTSSTPKPTTTPVSIADNVDTFDASTLIGSATVTGTNGDGLKCRVAPKDSAATLMVLGEGTRVQVFAEPQNGYLGINCGGLKGYADVNFLWSGGAGDGEIPRQDMSVVVTGTGNGLNCRTGASTSYPVITVLSDGDVLKTLSSARGGWTPVTCGGQGGWVYTSYVEVRTSSTSGSTSTSSRGTGTVSNTNGDGLRCRSGAGTSYSTIMVLGPGASVSVRGASQGGWVPVTCGGVAGWVSGQYLTVKSGATSSSGSTSGSSSSSSATGKATVANTGGDRLNCRAGAGTNYGVITSLALGQSVSTRSGSVSGWTAVICGGRNGFVSSQYLSGTTSSSGTSQPAAPSPSGLGNGDHAVTTDALNLRYEASLGSGVAAVAPAGTVVQIIGAARSGYFPVNWDGLKGFMSDDYLKATSAALSQRGGSGSGTTAPTAPSGSGTATGNSIVDFAMRYIGYPYVWATHGPASFDCSGFTYWVVKNVLGKDIGYGTWTQVSAGTRVSKSSLQPGDLVFFQNTYTAGLSHVGIYIGGGQFVHSQNEDTGVVVSDLNSTYYGPRWYGGVRL